MWSFIISADGCWLHRNIYTATAIRFPSLFFSRRVSSTYRGFFFSFLRSPSCAFMWAYNHVYDARPSLPRWRTSKNDVMPNICISEEHFWWFSLHNRCCLCWMGGSCSFLGKAVNNVRENSKTHENERKCLFLISIFFKEIRGRYSNHGGVLCSS